MGSSEKIYVEALKSPILGRIVCVNYFWSIKRRYRISLSLHKENDAFPSSKLQNA